MARMKIIIGIAFLGILLSLAAAGVFMLKSDDTQAKSNHMARALALRIGISVALFVLILVCLLYTSPSPRDGLLSRMPSSA